MTRQDKRSMMLNLVEQWQQSGMSQIEFARVQGLKLVKLRYWIHKQRQNSEGDSAFVQLNNFTYQGISIRYPNGVELTLPSQTPANFLRLLISF